MPTDGDAVAVWWTPRHQATGFCCCSSSGPQAGMDRAIFLAIQLYLPMCVGFVLRNLSPASRDSLIGDHEKWVSLLFDLKSGCPFCFSVFPLVHG